MSMARKPIFTAVLLLASLLLAAGCGRPAAPEAEGSAAPREAYAERFQDWNSWGIPSEYARGCLDRAESGQPLTREEAAKLARDVAATFVDLRFASSDAAKPECRPVKDGWEVTLRLKRSLGGEVSVRMADSGWIVDLHVVSEPKEGWNGTQLSQWQESANRGTAERLGGGEQLAAALTALDVCRILAPHVDRLYVRDISRNDRGDWEVRVYENIYGCDNASWTLLLCGESLALDRFQGAGPPWF